MSISEATRYSWRPWLSDFTGILIKVQPWTVDRSVAGFEIPVGRSSCGDAAGVRGKAFRWEFRVMELFTRFRVIFIAAPFMSSATV